MLALARFNGYQFLLARSDVFGAPVVGFDGIGQHLELLADSADVRAS